MDLQYAPPQQSAPPQAESPSWLDGLWEQDALGNGFLQDQLAEGATTGLWNRLLPSVFGPERKPEKARTFGDQLRSRTDRVAASMELEDRFHVGEGQVEGKATVTQEEYDQIVALYSDIRLGRGAIKLDTTGLSEEKAAAFRQGTMGDIAALLQTPSGRAMLGELNQGIGGHTTTLGYTDQDPDTDASLPGLDMGDVDDRWKLHDALHKGGGADSRVNYAPGKAVETKHEGAIRSDITLYHELTHAWHNARGQNAEGGVHNTDGAFVGHEELETVGLGPWANLPYTENRYREERGRLGEKIPRRETYGGVRP